MKGAFVEFTDLSGPILINSNNIIFIKARDGGTLISCRGTFPNGQGVQLTVNDTYEDVKAALKKAQEESDQ